VNRESAAQFIAGTLAGWSGYSYIDLPSISKRGLKKPKAAEREVFDRFGENVMLAFDLALDELERVQ
jgi:hypothetical protein